MADIIAALAGNPNAGKSTLFNLLTGGHQHTGNWTGKTVESAAGKSRRGIEFVDLPGTYSLRTRSAEEEAARAFIESGGADVIVAVCDACNPRRGLALALQLMELTARVVVCITQTDEAARRGITVDAAVMERMLGVPVTAVSARKKSGIDRLCRCIKDAAVTSPEPVRMRYPAEWERELCRLEAAGIPRGSVMGAAWEALPDEYASMLLARPILTAEEIADAAVSGPTGYSERDRRLDRILIHPVWAVPVMLALLAGILWLTVFGSNLPSAMLEELFLRAEEWLRGHASPAFEPLIGGALHTVLQVIAVMLPPMAIFFPLFTLAEEFGLLGRIAFNLDGALRRCGACGKQALTMCMSLGCTCVGVTGCRIIDSPRERRLAMLTASFMPCNGKFPMLIAVAAMLAGADSAGGALLMTGMLLLAIAATLAVCRLLSATCLRGEVSAFTLELPCYRRPPVLRILWHSLLDRTLYVLARAAAAAAPAGLLIWTLSNLRADGTPLLVHAAAALEPAGAFLGLDGVILLAFVLGFPANELVLPLILTGYAAMGVMPAWEPLTCLNLLILTLFHVPCAASLMTIAKEGGVRCAAAAAILPAAVGTGLCALNAFML